MINQYYISIPEGEPVVTPEPTTQLFEWTYSDVDNSDYDTLTGLSSKIDLYIPPAEGDDTYNHHAVIEKHPAGFLMAMHSTHDYDEEGIGMFCSWQYSDDDGDTWSSPAEFFPPQDVNERRDNNTGRVAIPMDWVVVNGQCYGVCDVNDRDFTAIPTFGARIGVGFLARKVNNDKSLGPIVWIHNADNSFTAPAPVAGFDSYPFDEDVRDLCYRFMWTPENNQKVSFSDQESYDNRIESEAEGGTDTNWYAVGEGGLAEPTTIKPYGYQKMWKFWKNYASGVTAPDPQYKIITLGDDQTNFYTSAIPDCRGNQSIVTRFWQYDPNTIFISGNVQENREVLWFAIMKRRESDGKYVSQNVYTIDENDTPTPRFSGHGKAGGPQSVDMLVKDGYVYFIYSEFKESIHLKKWQIDEQIINP